MAKKTHRPRGNGRRRETAATAEPTVVRTPEGTAQVQPPMQLEAIAAQPPAPPVVTSLDQPTTLEGFTKTIENVVTSANQPLWFRGTSSEDYPLTPSLFRHPTKRTAADLFEIERKALDWFRRRSVPYVRLPGLESDLDYMFLMQHHGAPTRLLDWTENPYIALFFALTSERKGKKDNGDPVSDNPCVWVLNPVAWNRHTLRHQTHPGTPLSASDDALPAYLSNRNLESLPKNPVTLFGTHNSQRIVSQRGVFCLFGKDIRPMEELARSPEEAYPDGVLRRMVIDHNYVTTLTRALIHLGFSDAMMFPDLDGLARELKRSFEF